jgi:hypothetical protein
MVGVGNAPRCWRPHAFVHVLILTLAAGGLRAQPVIPFLYERTSYVEGLISPLAWWANPALAAGCEEPTLYTANASPVGTYYTISSVRFYVPLPHRLVLGMGVMGAGADQTGSFNATEQGATYEGDFFFSRPSFQAGIAGDLPAGLKVGGLLSFGLERLSVGVDLADEFFVLGMGAGVLSPRLAGILQVSLAAYWAGHFQYESYWDSDVKVGLVAILPGDLVKLKLEYTQPMPEVLQFDDWGRGYSYEVLSMLASVRAASFLTILAGYSTDFGIADADNGNVLHLGVELPRTLRLSFFGGYELGLSIDRRWHIIHRIWLGYHFGSRDAEEAGESGAS